MNDNIPNFLLDRKASILILEALQWIHNNMNGNCDIILEQFEQENPDRFERLVVSPVFEQHWQQQRNMERLKSELRGWMREVKKIIDRYKK